jgi:hypothetical protein
VPEEREKMKQYVWLKPEGVVRIDFPEWTGSRDSSSLAD